MTRLYFMRLRRLARESLAQGALTPELAAARHAHVPTFTHFLNIPLLFVIVALGAARQPLKRVREIRDEVRRRVEQLIAEEGWT